MSHVVQTEDLCVSLKDEQSEEEVLRQVSVTLDEGRVLALLGPPGSGKTTLIHTLLGFCPPRSGTAYVLGSSVTEGIPKGRLGYMPQLNPADSYLSGHEYLAMIGAFHGMTPSTVRTKSQPLCDRLGIAEALGKRIEKYALRTRRLLVFVAAILHEPDLLLLDEPTQDLDRESIGHLGDLIDQRRQRGTATIIACSDLSLAERLCDDMAILLHGAVVTQGRRADLCPAEGMIESFYLKSIAQDREKSVGSA